MDVVEIGRTRLGTPVLLDRRATAADHVAVVNRVKPHTMFVGPIESGLMKMMLIGLGNREGANVYHRAIQQYSFAQIIRSAAGEVLRRCRIVAGLAIVENGYDQTARIEAIGPEDFEPREKELLRLARRLMARLPFEEVDVLLVPARALLQWLPSPEEWSGWTKPVRPGGNLPPDRFVLEALELGYRRVDTVRAPGEVSRRGGTVDIFPPTYS